MAGFRVILAACLVALFQVTSAATSHTVGDSSGWTIPTTSTLYSTWAAKQVVNVGDSLVFNFATGSHTVAEVSKSDYESCTTTSTISTTTIGPATITISTAGTHYYICTVAGHCSAGQKLAITTTTSSTTAPTPSSAASPASSTEPSTPSETSGPSSSTIAPPPSSATSVVGAGLVLPFLFIAASFVF